jgi:glycosyltransferase involved in cell wall biosynthesis
MRYAWDLQAQYLEQAGLGRRGPGRALARLLLHYMRLWDSRTANGVDHFVANSAYIACRIRKVYQREAAVLPPPVDVDSFQLPRAGADHAGGFYLAVSRMVPYKRVDTIVTAFSRQLSGKRLVVVGDGPLRRKCERIAAPNVEFLGHVDSSRLIALLQSADALVYSAEEDFGITMAEALACGTPVIAYGRGGSLEIVEEGVTGVLFDRQDPEAIADAVEHFERTRALLRPERMRSSVERLHPREFRRSFEELVSHAFAVWDANRTTRHVGGVGAAP